MKKRPVKRRLSTIRVIAKGFAVGGAEIKETLLQWRDQFNGRQLLALLTLFIYLAGVGSGFLLWGRGTSNGATAAASAVDHAEHIALGEQVNPPEGYTLEASFGDAGPKMLTAGAIDHDRFVQLYDEANRPLSEAQLAILEQGSQSQVVLNKQNAYFLLNFFWALGLANQNAILTDGPMMQKGEDQLGRFASTGGWTLGSMPSVEFYASTPIVTLSEVQQERLEEVAMNVFRPCCNNSTYLPDCNHGMAMLGLLELMASQDATSEEMFSAAKYANAFWYPAQSLELAQYFKVAQSSDFGDVDSRELVSRNYSSGSGFQAVHQWLSDQGLLPQPTGGGSSCGV